MGVSHHRTARRFLLSARSSGLALIVLLASAAVTDAAIHPFYTDSLEAGKVAYDQEDFDRASECFRVAAFGMLEEPAALADALVRMGLAQAELGDRVAFQATFARLSQIENDFQAYSGGQLQTPLRSRFEEEVAKLIPPAALADSQAFADLYRRLQMENVRALLPAARTAELERLVAEHPEDLSWQLMLANARVESGAGAAAIAGLQQMLSTQAEDQRVECLLGRALLQARQCEAVVASAASTVLRCDVRRLPTAELNEFLDCLTSAERWMDAASLVVSLPADRRSARPFPKWEKRIAREVETDSEIATLPAFTADRIASEQEAPSQPSPPVPPVRKTAKESREAPESAISSLRQQLAAARTVAELQAVAMAAEALERDYPTASEALFIAGEAAYRASKWQLAVDYLQAEGGPPGDRPELLFYLSVSLFELGERDAAARTLRLALPGLERTPIVERYRKEILQ